MRALKQNPNDVLPLVNGIRKTGFLEGWIFIIRQRYNKKEEKRGGGGGMPTYSNAALD